MKRVLATSCFMWFGTRLVAAYLPPVALWLLAAVFVSSFLVSICIKPWKYGKLFSLIGLTALVFHGVMYCAFVKPVLALAGQTVDTTVVAEQVSAGFQENTVKGQFTVLELNGKTLSGAKRFQVSCNAFPEVSQGDVVRVTLQLQPLEQDSYYYSNLSNGVLLQATAEQNAQKIGTSHALRFVMARLQKSLAETCRRYLPKNEGAVLAAMSVGDSSYLTSEIKAQYRAAGITHLLVVSGQHLTLLCGVFSCRQLGSKYARILSLASIGMVLFVMALNGFSPSISRAGVAALIFYVGTFLYQPADGLTSLGVAAVLLTLSNCYAVCDLGLQLSFAATLGVLLAGATVKQWKIARKQAKKPASNRVYKLVELLLIPVYSALFTLPIQLMNDLPVSGVSVLANLFVMPFVGPVVIFGLMTAFCGLLPGFVFGVRFFALFAGVFTKIINQIVAFTVDLPGAQLMLPKGYTLFVVAILGVMVWLGCRWNCRRQTAVIVFGLAIMSVMLYSSLQKDIVIMEITGNNSSPCAVILYQNQSLVLFQGGESNRQSVVQVLQEYGVNQADLWVDLRDNPESLEIQAKQLIAAKELREKNGETIPFGDIRVTIINAGDAELAVLQIKGYRIGVMNGTLSSIVPLPLDLLLAGSKQPGTIQAVQIIAAKEYQWHAEWEDTSFRYMPIGSRIRIRPGKAVEFKGV